jgi:hypothetical protein
MEAETQKHEDSCSVSRSRETQHKSQPCALLG